MKNYLFLAMAVIASVFSSCKDDDEKHTPLPFIQVKVTSDDAIQPDGFISLFYLDGYEIAECPGYKGLSGYDDRWVYAETTDGKFVDPVTKGNGNRFYDFSEKYDYSVEAIYWDDYSFPYGIPPVGGKYVLYVQSFEGNYPRAFKEFVFDQSKKITVHLPSATEFRECVEATWKIVNSADGE